MLSTSRCLRSSSPAPTSSPVAPPTSPFPPSSHSVVVRPSLSASAASHRHRLLCFVGEDCAILFVRFLQVEWLPHSRFQCRGRSDPRVFFVLGAPLPDCSCRRRIFLSWL